MGRDKSEFRQPEPASPRVCDDDQMPTRRRMKPLSMAELDLLSTARLLQYRQRLLALEGSFELSDFEAEELELLDPGFIYFKDTPEWVDLHTVLKQVLDEREHIDR